VAAAGEHKLLGFAPFTLLLPAALGGRLAVIALYDLLRTLAGNGAARAFGLGVLTVIGAGVARSFVFGGGPDLIAKSGLPPVRRGAEPPPSTRH
jgi:hypothetical protein